ncbi:MAG: RNA polymerase sigma-70 factor [Bacteroidales bacterium]|nr:RNA polymerase sigma-70 factor [Bacteroidales bacterium]
MNHLHDNLLFTKIKEGNQNAFEVLFLRYYSDLCGYANTILGNKESSEEIVQDMFVKLWENRASFDITKSLKAYLYRTVHNLCLNQLESIRVREQYINKINTENKTLNNNLYPFSGDYPIANLILKEMESKIAESIEALPHQCKEVFVHIRIKNLSYIETAEKLNISLNTVKTQMNRAINKLRHMLHEYLPVGVMIMWYYF